MLNEYNFIKLFQLYKYLSTTKGHDSQVQLHYRQLENISENNISMICKNKFICVKNINSTIKILFEKLKLFFSIKKDVFRYYLTR